MAKSRKVNIRTLHRKFAKQYFTPEAPNSFGSVSKFVNAFPHKQRTAAKKWLLSQHNYQLHKPVIKRFKRRKTIANFQEQIQADLVDLNHISKDNNSFRYLITAVDVFSKKGWVEPIKRKDTKSVVDGFEKILQSMKFTPRIFHSDQGKEFVNSSFQAMLKRYNIEYFTSKDASIKCALVERFNRTILNKIYKFLTKNNTHRYLEILPNILAGYNLTPHSSHGLPPAKITHLNKEIVWLKLFNNRAISYDKKKDFNKGDYVRIANRSKTFTKSYKPQWSREVFRINKLNHTDPITYVLEDLAAEIIDGDFYSQELTKTSLPTNFDIESILDKKPGIFLVKWLGYPKKFNSWVSSKSITNI